MLFKTFPENHPSDSIFVIIGDWMLEANMMVFAGGKKGLMETELLPTNQRFSKRFNLLWHP